jgi:hypothetical protein
LHLESVGGSDENRCPLRAFRAMLQEGMTIFVTKFLFKMTTNHGNSGKCFVLNLLDW